MACTGSYAADDGTRSGIGRMAIRAGSGECRGGGGGEESERRGPEFTFAAAVVAIVNFDPASPDECSRVCSLFT